MVTRPWSAWVRAVGVPLAVAGVLVVASLALTRIYRGDLGPRLLAGAAVAPVAVSLAARRLPAWCVAPLSVTALAGYTTLAVRLSASSGEISGPLTSLAGDALRNGIPRLLSATIPIEPQPDTIALPVIATWLAGLASAELAVRGRRVLLGYAPATVLLIAALYVVGPNAPLVLWQPLAFAGFAALGLAASSARPAAALDELDRRHRLALRARLATGAAAALAAVVALVATIGPAVANRVDHRPSDPRRYVIPPQLDSLDESPLVRLSGWALNGDQPLFDVALTGTGAGTGGGSVVRLAVLNDYDGVTWRVGATYRNVGRVLTGPPVAAGPTTGATAQGRDAEVTQRITIAELSGRLLPAMAAPRRVDGVRVAFDQASGTVAYPRGLRTGLTYTVVSHRPTVDPNLLASADVPAGDSVARFVALGDGVPPELPALAAKLSDGAGAPYQRAQAVAQFLAEHYRLVKDAPSGHAYPNLKYFLFDNAAGRRGTSEQFAASFAVLARIMGLPTRVVVGFQTQPTGGGSTATIRGANAYAWPEVLFTGLGWVAFDPLPQPNSQPRSLEEEFRPKPAPTTPPPPVVPAPSTSVTPAPSSTPAAAPAAPAGAAATPVLLAGASGTVVLTVVAFLIAVPLLRRTQRRRRLYRGEPPQRVVGAWREVLDALRLAGRPAPRFLAAGEVVAHAVATAERQPRRSGAADLPVPTLNDLADLVNAVGFAPEQPDGSGARSAVAQAEAYVGELRARRPWWRRLLWSIDPRPLFWRPR